MGNTNLPNNGFGLRVINVRENSPGKARGLVEFVDFIIGVESIDLPNFQVEFSNFLERNINKEIPLTVYNIISQESRVVRVNANRSWPDADSVLGIKVKWEKFLLAEENIFRISKVCPGSPGAVAGLKEFDDFVVGSSQFDYENFEKFLFSINYAYNHMDNPKLDFGVYNLEEDKVRIVTIYPSRNWGGEGILGIEFGLGFLNDLAKIKAKEDARKEALRSLEVKETGHDHGDKGREELPKMALESQDEKKEVEVDQDKEEKEEREVIWEVKFEGLKAQMGKGEKNVEDFLKEIGINSS